VRILTRYVLKEITAYALLGLALFSFVLFTRDTGRLLDLLVRAAATPTVVAWLFCLVLPGVFLVTIPVAVLVGVLIGLSRLASDSEVTAARAGGLGVRAFLTPVLLLAVLGTAVGLFNAAWLGPRAVREFVRLEAKLGANQVSAEVQPRVFEERFPNLVLYVQDVPSAAAGSEWRGVFLADLQPGATPAGAAPGNSGEPGPAESAGPKITVAEVATTLPDPARNQIQLHLASGSTHHAQVPPPGSADGNYIISGFSETDISVALPAAPASRVRPFTERYTSELRRVRGSPEDIRLAGIELHRRLALPVACFVLALVAVPLGVSSRKGGKSMGVVLTVLLVVAYYLLLVFGISLARQGRASAGAGVWLPNAVFLVTGVFLLARADRIPRSGGWRAAFAHGLRRLEHGWMERWRKLDAGTSPRRLGARGSLAPQLLDGYVVRSFLFYFLTSLAGFLALVEVINLFELLNDIIRHQASWLTVASYFWFLAPQLIYVTAPMAVLVGALVSFALLTKSNEVTAMKACGISLYRISAPVILTAAGISAGLFAFDYFYLPQANRRQDALRNQIKGRPAQTYLRPDRPWILGQGSRIYHYSYFDPASNVIGGLQVFELDLRTFALRRRVSAARAQWSDNVGAWILEDGWVRDFRGLELAGYRRFTAEAFPDLEEKPSYFRKEVKTSQQMSYPELRDYIRDLEQSGFDVVPLVVQLHKKFAFPLYALIMALIAAPFAFTVGRRGALAGVAAGIGIAVVYWTVTVLFEKLGAINELPAVLASWAPAAMFGMTGVYALLRVRS
jgi:LPS export ABC transporter permease LptG/LPS export ABC transporter permease LptF